MHSLTNKTANIKYKNLSVYKTVRATESYIQNRKNLFFFRKVDGFYISSFYQLFWKKKILAVLDV